MFRLAKLVSLFLIFLYTTYTTNHLTYTQLTHYNEGVFTGGGVMPYTPGEMMRLLKRNGFTCIRVRGSHYRFYNESSKRSVTVPNHSKDLKKGTEHQILKDAGLLHLKK